MKTLSRLLAFPLFLFLTSALFAKEPVYHHAMIVDAGSTGTRVHLYEYSTESKIPVIHELFSASVKPGLSFYEKTPQEAGVSLATPLDATMAELKKRQIDPRNIPISVFATAGMRLLPKETQTAIYDNVSSYIQGHYPFHLAEIMTIPGEVEGLFGWLDVNYLAQTFEKSEDATLGSIDVGGGSIQVVFSTQDTKESDQVFKFSIADHDYFVYSKSFLGLGLNEALNQVNLKALAATCYPAHSPASKKEEDRFNFKDCRNLYTEVIDQHHVREQLPSLGNKEFVAYSGAYYTTHFFEADTQPSQEVLDQRVQAVCNQSFEQIVDTHPKEPKTYLSAYCANGVYLSQLLFDAYQLKGNQLKISNQINGQNLDWALGALFFELQQR